LITLALLLLGCNTGANTETGGGGGESAPTTPGASPENSAAATPSDTTPSDAPGDEPAYWDGFNFGPNLSYAEEYEYQGDPGEYMNPAEAAKLVFDDCKRNGYIPEYSDETEYRMVLVDLADFEGEECYVYRLDVDEPTGTIGAAYAYAYQRGIIYMQGLGGQWVPLTIDDGDYGEEDND
jgi:hypothetical protein